MTRRTHAASARRTQGFTLVEVMVTLPLVALLMIGSFNLFLMSLRLGTKTAAQLVATQDAANAIQQVVEVGREAYTISLLGNGLTPPAGDPYPDSAFAATLNGQTINTGIYVTMPAALAPTDVPDSYKNTSWTYITVRNAQGSSLPPSSQNAPLPSSPYNFSSPTPAELATQARFLIYRADSGGTPDPTAGGYLWEQPLPVSVGTPGFALCRTVATGTPNAVQFVQPVGTANQIEVKVVSGVYSAVNGVQTDEEGNGTYTSQLDGKCILMRDHIPIPPGSGTLPGGAAHTSNPFQAH